MATSVGVTNLPNHWVQLYNENFGQATQQMESRLKNFVTLETGMLGERKRFDDLSARDNLTENTTRAGATRRRDASSSSRWLYAGKYDDAVVIDEWDEDYLAEITAPASDLLTSMNMAIERTCDKRILTDLTADVYTGKAGTATSSFPAAQTVAENFSYNADGVTEETNGSVLSVDKIRKSLEILGTAEAIGFGLSRSTNDRPVLALRAKDKNHLFAEVEVINGDYNNRKPFSDGVLEEFLGVRLVNTEQLSTAASVASCMMWLPSAFHFHAGQWKTHMDLLPENSHALQVRVVGRIGGMRRYDERVVEIEVTE